MDEWERNARARIEDAIKYRSLTVTLPIEAALLAEVVKLRAERDAYETYKRVYATANDNLRAIARELAAALSWCERQMAKGDLMTSDEMDDALARAREAGLL